MASSISAVTRIGALRPNTCAAEMTTSESPQVFFIASRCFWICSSVKRLRVAVLGLAGFADINLEKLRAERFHLFLDDGPRVVGGDFGAQPFGGGDRLQTGDADADDENLRRQNRSRRRGHHRKNLVGITRGQDDRLVTAQIGLRGQHVHLLRAGRARNEFHADGAHAAFGKFLDQLLFVERIEQAGVDGARFEPGNFLHRRFAQAQHDVAGTDQRLAVGGDGRTGFDIGVIGKAGGEAEAGLDFNLGAELDEFGDAIGRQRRPAFARMGFAWN